METENIKYLTLEDILSNLGKELSYIFTGDTLYDVAMLSRNIA